jgi:hypothetical protein
MLIYSMSVSVDGLSPIGRARSGGRSLVRSSLVSTSRRCASSAAICAAAGFTRRCWCGRRIRRDIDAEHLRRCTAVDLSSLRPSSPLRRRDHGGATAGGLPDLPASEADHSYPRCSASRRANVSPVRTGLTEPTVGKLA